MLRVNQLAGFGARRGTITPGLIVFGHGASNSSSPLNTFNQAGVSFGSEAASRQMLMLVYGGNANVVSDGNFTTSAAIGGVAATRIFEPAAPAASHFTAWMTARQDAGGPSGATGAISATRSTGNGYNTVALALFALYDLADPSLAAFDMVQAAANPVSLPLDVPARGIVAAMAQAGNTAAHTWTGAIEQFDATGGPGGSQRFSAAMASGLGAQAGYTLTCGNGVTGVFGLALSFQ